MLFGVFMFVCFLAWSYVSVLAFLKFNFISNCFGSFVVEILPIAGSSG